MEALLPASLISETAAIPMTTSATEPHRPRWDSEREAEHGGAQCPGQPFRPGAIRTDVA